MAGLVRKTILLFGSTGPTSNFGQFGSKEAGSPQTSKDPAVIQALSAYGNGWQDAVVSGDKAAYIEDMSGLCFVQSYGEVYLYQMGIPEWDSATLYFTGSIVQTQTNGQFFQSLQGGVPGVGAGQSGNAPPVSASNAFWLWINPPQDLVGSATLNTLQKVTSTSPANGSPGSVVLGDSLLSETGGNVVLASGGIKFPDATVQTTAAVNSSVSSKSIFLPGGSRALNTTYTAPSGPGSKPVFVTVSVACAAGQTVSAQTGATVTEVARGGSISGTTGVDATVSFWALPGENYTVISAGTFIVWTEWK